MTETLGAGSQAARLLWLPPGSDGRRLVCGGAALAGLIASVCAANWLVAHVGTVYVGFGLHAPAAVLVVGVAFTLRDVAHRAMGPAWVVAAVVVGAALSVAISPTFALVSGCVFLTSELADLLVYTSLAERSWLGAVALSNCVALLVDSVLFLWLAFGSLDYLWGQVVGKAWMTAVAVGVIIASRTLLRPVAPARR